MLDTAVRGQECIIVVLVVVVVVVAIVMVAIEVVGIVVCNRALQYAVAGSDM